MCFNHYINYNRKYATDESKWVNHLLMQWRKPYGFQTNVVIKDGNERLIYQYHMVGWVLFDVDYTWILHQYTPVPVRTV